MGRWTGILQLSLVSGLSLNAGYLGAANETAKREEGALVYDGVPLTSASQKERLEQHENVRSASLQDWLKNELLISTRFADSNQLHRIKAPLHYREQLTFANEPINNASVRPRTDEIYYLKDMGGNEFTQIYRFDVKAGKSELLTDGKSKNTGIVWQKSGDGYAFTSTMRNGKDSDIYFLKPGEKFSAAKILVEEGGSWEAIDWNKDGTQLIVEKQVSISENYFFILDVAHKKLSPLMPGGKFRMASARFAKDGKSIYLVHDKTSEFQTLYQYDLKTEKLLPLSNTIAWDIESIELSDDGKTLAFVSNENGTDVLDFLDTQSKAISKIQNLPLGVIGRIKFPEGKSDRIAFSLSHAKGPSDVFTYDLRSKKLEVWTESEVGGLNRDAFVTPEPIAFPTFDQTNGKVRTIPGFYYKASKKALGDQKKSAVVILIHGGPEARFQPGFNSTVQAFTGELGVSVIAPNVRGSSGYGKTYLGLDNGFLREDSVKDIGALLEWIKTRPELDDKRVLVMGGSYGGYMVLASLVHYSDRLAGGIENVGISHFVTFLKNTQAYRQDLRRVEYGDERDPKMKEFLEKISPLTNVKAIKKPLLVVQGLNDPRVPSTEAEQIVKAVRDQGLESWYLLAKDEGHGFRKKKNQAVYLQTVMMFAEKILSTPSKVGSEDRS